MYGQLLSLLHRGEELVFDWFWFGKDLKFSTPMGRYGEGFFGYLPTRLWTMRKMFREVDLRQFDMIVDGGCGAGRFIRFALMKNRKAAIYGIEIDSKLVDFARKKFSNIQRVEIIEGDMCVKLPPAPGKNTLVFLFNPLDFKGIKKLKSRIEELYTGAGDITIAYVNPLQLQVFRNSHLWKISTCRREVYSGHKGTSEFLYAFISSKV